MYLDERYQEDTMADEEKTKKAAEQEPASSSQEEKPEETATEGGASEETSASPSPVQVTLTQEQMERLCRKLKAKYH
jgi:hypothetical protein